MGLRLAAPRPKQCIVVACIMVHIMDDYFQLVHNVEICISSLRPSCSWLLSMGMRLVSGHDMTLISSVSRFGLLLKNKQVSFSLCIILRMLTMAHECAITRFKVVLAYWKVKTPCHAHGECIN